jgi:uncharacterized protein YqiB (DUF1249 family)
MSFAQPKPRYVPNLIRQAALCEMNYARLIRLLPDLDAQLQRSFTLANGQVVQLDVTEQFKYTLTVELKQLNEATPWVQPIQMKIRMYHDARMAEAIGYQDTNRLEGCYKYPNPKMFLPDEKAQLNIFLTEWLKEMA